MAATNSADTTVEEVSVSSLADAGLSSTTYLVLAAFPS